jgi:hypothetical protein
MVVAEASVKVASAADRRRTPRVALDVAASVVSDRGVQLAQCKDLSMSGAGVEIFHPLPRGSTVRLRLEVSYLSLDVAAEVVREGVYPHGIAGLELRETREAALATLFSLLRRGATEAAPHHGFFADD